MGTFITLITDFGLADGYVGALKGVIYSLNPEATIVDISHTIQPQNIRQAAFVLSTVYPYFPSYTVHLIVVDPGVGTNRRAIILKTPRAHFVAPDNGVLSYVLEDWTVERLSGSQRVKVAGDVSAYVITRSEYWRKPVSDTFHGRDIFAPVAARLSLGLMAISLGDKVDTLTAFVVPHPIRTAGGLIGHVQHIDSFGNLITDIRKPDLPPDQSEAIIIFKGRSIHGLSNAYGAGVGPLALFGSSGFLEIAVAGGSAEDYFQAEAGDEVTVNSKSGA
jgi:S-adenosyl-L-methionine hydrolase (adenosine-forming)